MNKAVFLTGEEKVNLAPEDLFDRIINLKITCYNKANKTEREEYVIRSDYELIYPDSNIPVDGTLYPGLKNKYIIRKCTHKPSIKVNYTMATSNTGIGMEVFITNFFMFAENGKYLRSFNASNYVIEKVEIAMGYWGQFRIGKERDNQVPSYEEYFVIDAKNGADKITMSGGAIVVTTESLPPDSVLHIKGPVADIFSAPLGVTNITVPSQAIKQPVATSGTSIEQVFFDAITRRYLNRHNLTKEENAKILASAPYSEIQVSKFQTYGVPITVDSTAKMSEEDAKNYGVKVYISDKVKGLTFKQATDTNGNKVDKIVYFEEGWTIGNTIARIASLVSTKLNYTYNRNGDVLIFMPGEFKHPNALYASYNNQGLYKDNVFANKKLYDNKLPAVYNINIDAVATITCPFFTFLEPFQKIEFSSRYALTSLVSYYASYSPKIYQFLVIRVLLSFATVEDINEVQITAVAE